MSNKFEMSFFENDIGQTINPGDKVVYVSTAWKRTKVRKAVFEGVYRDEDGDIVAVRVGGVPDRKFVSEWDPIIKAYQYHHIDIVRKAILPLKRVYALKTPLEEFEGKDFANG